jgi:uncharacterized protein YecE (DUF72 family)
MVKVGCCGFPLGRTQYATRLRVVELQQTFYAPPRVETARSWREAAPRSFEFTLKAWQLITHEASSPTYRRLKPPLSAEERGQAGSFQDTPLVRHAWQITREIALTLEASIIVFQCPARFGPAIENIQRLRRFFSEISRDNFILAWEPRGDWPRDEVAALCRELDLLPALDPFATPPLPGPWVYFRLHGKGGYRYTYTEEDLAALAALVASREEAYVMFNNLSMWQDALRFQERLAQGPAQAPAT